MLEYLNKDLFNGELDLSNISYLEFDKKTNEHKFINLLFTNFGYTTVKKIYLPISEINRVKRNMYIYFIKCFIKYWKLKYTNKIITSSILFYL